MISHHELIAEMETIKQKMAEAKKNERSDTLKEVKVSLTEGRKKK